MSGTILYAAETTHQDKLLHVMGYQNRAENLGRGPNAMLLPIPSASPMGPDNAIDMRACKNVLRNYETAVLANKRRSRGMTKGFGADAMIDRAQVFDSGSYTVVLARDANQITEALTRVPVNRRPQARPDIFAAYAKLYPNWHIAMCCYDGTVDAEPMVWQYEPLDPSRLFAPALDGHDGKVPNLAANNQVQRDHTLIVSLVNAPRTKFAMELDRQGNHQASGDIIPPTHDHLFGRYFHGAQHHGPTQNGDFYFAVQNFAQEGAILSNMVRNVLPPPGA